MVRFGRCLRNETQWALNGIQNTQRGKHRIFKSAGCSSLPSQLHYHMRVDFLSAVDVGCGSGELQQLVRLVHHQRGVELAQPQQVAAEHPAETEREGCVERVSQSHLSYAAE